MKSDSANYEYARINLEVVANNAHGCAAAATIHIPLSSPVGNDAANH
jgi:hypothetical protein